MIRGETFRPWGLLPRVIQRFDRRPFTFIGGLSTEERSLAAFSYLHSAGAVAERRFYSFGDAASRFSREVERRLDQRRSEVRSLGVDESSIFHEPLLGLFGRVADDFSNFLRSSSSPTILIDISSMPKRFFFFAIRQLLGTESMAENVIVTYTEPAAYHDGSLAENPGAWHALPGFLAPRSEPQSRALIVALGFEPLGLPELYSSGQFAATQTHLLLPISASQRNVARNWDFVRMLESEAGTLSNSIERIDARNVPDVFDALAAITRRGEIYSVLAPFGPKPVSLAMCLYACATGDHTHPASVFYTQPTVYNPNYSVGVGNVCGAIATHAYCVRLSGKNLFDL